MKIYFLNNTKQLMEFSSLSSIYQDPIGMIHTTLRGQDLILVLQIYFQTFELISVRISSLTIFSQRQESSSFRPQHKMTPIPSSSHVLMNPESTKLDFPPMKLQGHMHYLSTDASTHNLWIF